MLAMTRDGLADMTGAEQVERPRCWPTISAKLSPSRGRAPRAEGLAGTASVLM